MIESEESMSDPHGTSDIPTGIPVIGFDGKSLGIVREVFPHYILVHEEGEHDDLEVPVHAIKGVENGALRVSVTRSSTSPVDDVETAHRLIEDEE
jgi:hypothetical protein